MLSISRYRFSFFARDAGSFGALPGSAWRGSFGTALKHVVCAMRLRECEGCPLSGSCVFPYLFQGTPRPPVDRLKSLSRVPVPYVFDATALSRRHFAAGDQVEVKLSLVGAANRTLAYVVRAMEHAGARGVGPQRARLTLDRVHREYELDAARAEETYVRGGRCKVSEPSIPRVELSSNQISVRLLTPLRLRIRDDLVTPDRFKPAYLVDAAIRRVSALATFYGEPVGADYRHLKALSERLLSTRTDVHWFDWTRYSTRQKAAMKLGGIVGHFSIAFDDGSRPLLPWLSIGAWTGAGKGASMGLGQFRLRAET
jgi:hypothetical protein